MDILNFHKQLLSNYQTYIRSFLNIKDHRILDFVDAEIAGNKLWPEPLVQFNPTFEKGSPVADLVRDGVLHHALNDIFKGFNLYKHQEEAIRLGAGEKEFVVTSGTGSGKSLTYIATIFNHILNLGGSADNKIQAVVVYPMNALINSQFKEIEKFKTTYEKRFHQPFPISFQQYTGQESEEQKEKLRLNPPHILLTNYVMLELAMTRSGRDTDIRQNFLQHMKYLVFDELHTYRGRQGSDVSMLIRRIKAAADGDITCIGTSATMVSGDTSTLADQKLKVAEVASTIFGSTISPNQVVNEYLVRSIGSGNPALASDLIRAIAQGIDIEAPATAFEQHPSAIWLEEHVALESKEGVFIRRKPIQLIQMAEQMSAFCGAPTADCLQHLTLLLEWANKLNTRPDKKKNYLPYRIHQFIAQTGSVYSTLGDQQSRKLFLDAGRYADNKDTLLFPLVFSRTSGHEFTCVKLQTNDAIILPREFNDITDNDEDVSNTQEGYLFIHHEADEAPVWDPERDIPDLPETWFNPPRKDGTRKLKTERANRLPRKIWFNQQGRYSFTEPLDYEGWFITAPLMLDPSSGTIFAGRTAEWTKLMKLGGEGRSTATTVLAFETITQLHRHGQAAQMQKLLSFTDNRQDASLQAGHFNDFVQVGQLRAAIVKALALYPSMDYATIADRVFECLNITQHQFARETSNFPGQKQENESAFKDFIMYRLLYDLRRSWRVVLPNLEQCGLLTITYKHLPESAAIDELWASNELLLAMSPKEREEFLHQLFDFFRKSYALHYSMLEPGAISQNTRRIREKLRAPWMLEEQDKLMLPNFIRLDRLSSATKEGFTESGGYSSVFGRYIRAVAKAHHLESLVDGKDAYNAFTGQLLDLLRDAGWLKKETVKSADGQETGIYQLLVNQVLWQQGDGETIIPDLIKTQSYKPQIQKPNAYFKQFYQTDFHKLKPIEGKEHTGQINSDERKIREELFRNGEISSLFCSPTMELGIDISDLAIVHMRNVPPSPANYAQRSGRAGRSGQAALVMVYCSNFSAHDRHYFKHATQMVAGTVSAPRMDLINEELLLSHLNATLLTRRSLSALNNSIGALVDLQQMDTLPLKQEIKDTLVISDMEKAYIHQMFKKVIEDTYFTRELSLRKPTWFTDTWIWHHINQFPQAFDRALDRWRRMYKAAQRQISSAALVIDNRVYADDHAKKYEAHKQLRQAERQRDLLLNDPTDNKGSNKDQSEFYPYRYFAAEGLLPGYNFTRLPVRSFMENQDNGGDYISRARFIALNEFGPRNVIYHNGAKYRIDQMLVSEAEFNMESGKICPKTGYFLYDKQYGYEVDPITNEPLQLDTERHVHTTLLEIAETRAYELQRITCQEEERVKKGYDIQTYFSVDGGFENTTQGIVRIDGDKLLHLHYMPTCRIFKLNLKWKASKEQGFTLNIKNGQWQSKQKKAELIQAREGDSVKDVKLFTSNTANAIYIQPIKALPLGGGPNGVITLMFALKRAIENYFQVESNEIGATIMGEESAPNILIYEASEGSLGVLSQIMDSPSVYSGIMAEAYRLCFYIRDVETTGAVLPATYDDLLSFYNQQYHEQIDRNLIRDALKMLRESQVEIVSNKAFADYDAHYEFLQAARDANSSTEDQFLQFLYQRGIRLPDEAQPQVDKMYVRPDFFYKPNIYIFCDGTPHDNPTTRAEDNNKRASLKNAGYQVLSWHYSDSLPDFVAKRPDIFNKVKDV